MGEMHKHKSPRGIYSWVLIIAVLIAFVMLSKGGYVQNHVAEDDLNEVYYAFQSITYGDAEGFIDHGVNSFSFLGTFLLIFGLTYYLSLIVFRNPRLSKVLSLVMSIYAFIDGTVYNWILTVGAFGVGIIVFLALVMMLWLTTSGWISNSKGDFDETKKHKAESKALKEQLKKLIKESQNSD